MRCNPSPENEFAAMSHALFIINHEKVKIVTYRMR